MPIHLMPHRTLVGQVKTHLSGLSPYPMKRYPIANHKNRAPYPYKASPAVETTWLRVKRMFVPHRSGRRPLRRYKDGGNGIPRMRHDASTRTVFQMPMARNGHARKRPWVDPHIVLTAMMVKDAALPSKMLFEISPIHGRCPLQRSRL